MKKYLMLFCFYSPNNYVGYHKFLFEATPENAEKVALERLKKSAVRPIEYTVLAVGETLVGPKIFEGNE